MRSSTKFVELARTIAKRDKELFDSLLEFEKTKKIKTKERMNFTIDKSLVRHFKQYCRKNGYNMSAKIEQSIRALLEKNDRQE